MTRTLVLRAPGTNCDCETAFAFEQAGARVDRLHVNRIAEQPDLLREYQILCLPGGFCYGDDLAAGTILGARLRLHLGDALQRFHAEGKLILGICNGFQVLLKAGLLPGGEGSQQVSLAWNESARFEDRWVHLEVSAGDCVFLRGIERLYLPVAHAEGRFVAVDQDALDRLEGCGQIVLRYATDHDRGPVDYPANPNGSWRNVAGICDPTGRVFGLMPHPERHIDASQHPRATRQTEQHDGRGMAIFRNAVEYFR